MAPEITLRPVVGRAAATEGTSREAQARRAAESFESFFMSHFVSSMFEGIGDDPMFGGGQGESMYRSMMAEEFGRIAARAGGIGVADAVYREMLKMQEVHKP